MRLCKKLFLKLQCKTFIFSILIASIEMSVLSFISCKTTNELATDKSSDKLKKTHFFVMTYNVQNLYDTEMNAGYEDKIYLPLAFKKNNNISVFCKNFQLEAKKNCLELDWTEQRLEEKLDRLSQVILSVNQGLGPDILLLQEVENKKVLERLNQKYLSEAGYTIHYISGRDENGLGLAILTRFPQHAQAEYKEIDFIKPLKTRGILYVPLILKDKSILHVFNFHFPPQAKGTIFREQAMSFLNKWRSKLFVNAQVIAAGDTNITTPEEKVIYPKLGFPHWFLSHYEGCKNCLGTIYYPPSDSWSFFDVIFFSSTLYDNSLRWRVDPESIYIPNTLPFQLTERNAPNSYNLDNFTGVSNHWPMVLGLERK